MDFERINLLLDVFHKSLNVPNTEKIRDEIREELTQWNSPAPVVEDPQPELELKGRRL